MKKLLTLCLLAVSMCAFAQNKKIALLEPRTEEGSTISGMEKAMVRGELRKAIVNHTGYEAFTRSDIDQLMNEQGFQRTGNVSEEDIHKLGEMSGADYICVSTLNKSNTEFYLEAYLIDIESGVISNPASQYGELVGGKLSNMLPVCQALAQELLDTTNPIIRGEISSNVGNKSNVSYTQPMDKTEVQSHQQTVATQPAHGKKLQFNPQPSDNYIVGLTIGYVGRQKKIDGEKRPLWIGEGDKMTHGFMFGLTINPTFKYGIGLRTGLFLNYSRDAEKDHGETYYVNDITLSMPLQISYRYEIIKKLSVLLYTGPIFDFGVYANTNIWEINSGINKSDNLYSSKVWEKVSGNNKYIGFNCSWGIGAGIQWDRLRLDIGGEFGMVNKSKDMYKESNVTMKWDRPIYVTLTCFF